ncbi:uncharacterized protein [Halyomorpha halys]|uniref:uncharacterized protein n=1 Tax=Halyomorpha halys TaxID=286706 RepID=UPI0034D27F79
MKDLDVKWHLNTPGHPKSRGGVVRLHGMLRDHLRLYQADQGLEPDVAMPKAMAAYNHSVHTVTGFSPFEILFWLCGIRRDYKGTAGDGDEISNNHVTRKKLWEKVRGKLEREKTRRVAGENLNLTYRKGMIKIGTIVYIKLGSNRGNRIQRYEGLFREIIIREDNVVTIESIREPKKRRTVHIQQLKLPLTETPAQE